MSTSTRKSFPLGILVALAALAGLLWIGFWLFGKAYALTGGLGVGLITGIITAVTCTAMVVRAIHRSGASPAVRLRARADAYEATLTFVMRATEKPLSRTEWRRARARLLLWGSAAVLEEFAGLEASEEPLHLDLLNATVGVGALLYAMRIDLGQSDISMDDEEESEEDKAEEDKSEKDDD